MFMQPLQQWNSNMNYITWGFISSLRYPVCNAHVPLSYVACPTSKYFSTLSHKQHDFRKKSSSTWNVCCSFLYNFCLKHLGLHTQGNTETQCSQEVILWYEIHSILNVILLFITWACCCPAVCPCHAVLSVKPASTKGSHLAMKPYTVLLLAEYRSLW